MLIKSKKCEKCGKVYPTTAVSECPHSTREMDMMADKTLRPTEVDMLKAIADYRHILELNGHKPTRKDSLEAVLQLGIEKGRQMERERIAKELTELYVGNKNGLEGLIPIIPMCIKALKGGKDV